MKSGFEIILASSVIGAIIGSILKGIWDRNLSKKVPKTEKRAEAYKDFVAYFVAGSQNPDQETSPKSVYALNEIKSRLILFGESNVIDAAATFLNQHKILDKTSRDRFCSVVKEMRKSIMTGANDEVMKSISMIIQEGQPVIKTEGFN